MGQATAPELPSRLSVRSLAVVNESGTLVAELGESGLSIIDQRGAIAATIAGAVLTLTNEAGQQVRLDPGALRLGEGEHPLVLLGRNNTGGPGSTLVLSDGGPGSTATLSATIGAYLTLRSMPYGCSAGMSATETSSLILTSHDNRSGILLYAEDSGPVLRLDHSGSTLARLPQ
jgi:hypothetical protein